MAKTFEEVETDAHIAMGVSLSKKTITIKRHLDLLCAPPLRKLELEFKFQKISAAFLICVNFRTCDKIFLFSSTQKLLL